MTIDEKTNKYKTFHVYNSDGALSVFTGELAILNIDNALEIYKDNLLIAAFKEWKSFREVAQ